MNAVFFSILRKIRDKFIAFPHLMIGEPFIILDTIDSTNNHAMKLARDGSVSDGTVFFALEQTKGKGQMNKNWTSNKGENILMSIVLDCRSYQLNQQFLLSMATSLACNNVLKKYAIDGMTIKWPNDLYWRDRKAGGILIENIVISGVWETAVVGIGININQTQFDEMQRKPVSLKQITGKNLDPIIIAKEICLELDHYRSLLDPEKKELLLSMYNQVLYKRNELVLFRKDSLEIKAKIKGVNMEGKLILNEQPLQLLKWGELEWVE